MKGLYTRLLLGLTCCLFTTSLLAQDPLTISIEAASGDVGETVCVKIIGDNFDLIAGMQFSINFDPDVIRYTSGSGRVDGTNVSLVNPGSTPGVIRLNWDLFKPSGFTSTDPFDIAELCFEVLTTAPAVIAITDNPIPRDFSRNDNGDISEITNFTTTNGSINAGGTGGTMPTCSDGIQNGSETGIDCGGSCTPCMTSGGGNSNCGVGSSIFNLCLGENCGVGVGDRTCFEITVTNVDEVTAVQANFEHPAAQLDYASFTPNPQLPDAPQVTNPSDGQVRLIYLQQNQSMTNLADGISLGTVCFDNEVAGATNLLVESLRVVGTDGDPVLSMGNAGGINTCGTTPTCSDGIRNGSETGVDCGGNCAPCSTGGGGGNDGCGSGTAEVTFCVEEVCDIAENASVCLDIIVADFTDVTDVQMDVTFAPGSLFFQSATGNSGLASDVLFNVRDAGTVRLIYFPPGGGGGRNLPDNDPFVTVCFANQSGQPTPVNVQDAVVVKSDGQVNPTNIELNAGGVNTCGTVQPSCSDGVRNGNETGVDCGGSCAPCDTGGGGGDDCGMGTNRFSLCLSDNCDVPAGAETCLDIVAGNYDNVTSFQANITFPGANVDFTRTVNPGVLEDDFLVNAPNDGEVRLIYIQQSQTGESIDDGTVIAQLCFTNNSTAATTFTFDNLSGTDSNGDRLATPVGNSGSINGSGCSGGGGPTCSDGIQNGNETGVDCGGSCAPCDTGGTDDCGMGTDRFSLCLSDNCDVPVGTETCLDVVAGNYNNVTSFQANITFPGANVDFTRTVNPGVLEDDFLVNSPNDGEVRLIYIQQSQTGERIDDGTVIAQVCFTNNSGAATNFTFDNLSGTDSNGDRLATPVGNPGSINGNGCSGGGGMGNLVLDVADGSGAVGTEVCLDVNATGFNGITDFSVDLNYNDDDLRVDRVVPGAGIAGFGLEDVSQTDGRVSIDYTGNGPQQINNGRPLFTVCFRVEQFIETQVTLSNGSATDGNGDVTITLRDGTVNAGAESTDPTLQVSDADGALNTEVCVDLIGFNLTDVAGIQHDLLFDATKLRFESARSANVLNPFLISNPSAGVVRMLYVDNNLNGTDIPDPTALAEICFTVLEACETTITHDGEPQVLDGDGATVRPVRTLNGTVNEGTTCGGSGGTPNNIILQLGNADGPVNSEVCLDLTVSEFTNITDLSFSLTYDGALLDFAGAQNFGIGSIGASNVAGSTDGRITFDWSDASGQTLGTGDRLLSLCFDVEQLVTVPVDFTSSPVVIEANNAAGDRVGVIPVNGAVNPNAPVVDGLTFQLGNATGEVGDIVCLPVIGYGIVDLIGFQYTISYDPAIVEFVRTQNFLLNGLSENNSVVNTPGSIQTQWNEGSLQPTTVPSGVAVYEVCFRILQDGATTVSFTDSPTFIEFFTADDDDADVDFIPGQINGSMAPVIISATPRNPTCSDTEDGSISLVVSGATNLQYRWTGSNATGPVAGDLGAGDYSVTITNPETNETTSSSFTLTAPPALNVAIATVDGVSCNGEADGRIVLSASGGAMPYLIDWGGDLNDNELVQDNLDGGTYSVELTDDNGCRVVFPNVTVRESPALNVFGDEVNIGTNTPGGVTVVTSGGTTPITYSWTGPNGYTNDAEDIDDLTEVGTYCLTATDANGCEDQSCFEVGLALEVVQASIRSGCFGRNEGSIDVEIAGGNGTYAYEWVFNGQTIATSQDIDDLEPGVYTLRLSSGSQRTNSSFTVQAPEQIRGTVVITPATDGDNGAIDLMPTGGTAPYSYSWSTGSSDQDLDRLVVGEYCVTITDAEGCFNRQCFQVRTVAFNLASSSTRPASCSDSADGIVRLSVASGSDPYSYQIQQADILFESDSSTVEIMVPPGEYEVVVIDAQGEAIRETVTVDGPEAIRVRADHTSDTEETLCSGTISLTPSGGAGNYTYQWNSGETTADLTRLCAGDYHATVTDVNGCTLATDTFTVARIDERLDTVMNVGCESNDIGAVNVTISGGEEPYTYAWRRVDNPAVIAETEDLSGIGAGRYTLTVADATGAELIREYTVGVDADFSYASIVTTDFRGFNVSCSDAADGRIELVVSGTGTYSYQFLLGDELVGIDSVLTDARAGTYTVTVMDESGCEIASSVTVTAPNAIVIDSATVMNASCDGLSDGSINLSVSGGFGNLRYAWSNGNDDPLNQNLAEDTYTVTITDNNGCQIVERFDVEDPAALNVTFETTPAEDGCDGSILVLPLGGSGNFRYEWLRLDDQGDNPLAEGLCPGTYQVIVTDLNDCQTATMTATVEDRRSPCLSAREVITPDGDGLNDSFVIFCSGDAEATDNTLEIYNRWGQLVFEAANYSCNANNDAGCFEGRTNDGELLPRGAYYYVFDYFNMAGDRQQQRGSFTLLRD